MNPYLESPRHWRDFHTSFLTYAREALMPQVQPDYFVGIEEHLFVHDTTAENGRRCLGWADVAVGSSTAPKTTTGGTSVATLAPVEGLIPAPDIERQNYLVIRDRDGQSIVTVVELLSPANKHSGGDQEQFLAKREEVLRSMANYVEIDLLRAGHRPPVEGLPLCHYYALVSRPDLRPRAGLWPIQLRECLPALPIPLQSPRADAHLDLKAVLDRAYDAAGYATRIYNHPPTPRLAPDDAAWAQQFLTARP
jgi:hypothetical protein